MAMAQNRSRVLLALLGCWGALAGRLDRDFQPHYPPTHVLREKGLEIHPESGHVRFIGGPPYLPNKVNWTAHENPRVVGPVRDQLVCGSGCVVMPVSDILASQHALGTGHYIQLSAQELLDCASPDGCNGALPGPMYNWTITNGLTTAKDYPYVGKPGRCSKAHAPVAKGIGYFRIAQSAGEAEVAAFVARHGPLWAAFSLEILEGYKGGIIDKKGCSTALEHGAMIVGFDRVNDPPYWIVQNSWGTKWGEAGFFRIKMGVDECGVDQYVMALLG